MFAEIGCDFALWGDPSQALPVNGEEEAEDLEHLLPISGELSADSSPGRISTTGTTAANAISTCRTSMIGECF